MLKCMSHNLHDEQKVNWSFKFVCARTYLFCWVVSSLKTLFTFAVSCILHLNFDYMSWHSEDFQQVLKCIAVNLKLAAVWDDVPDCLVDTNISQASSALMMEAVSMSVMSVNIPEDSHLYMLLWES
jgi:hypothetical protein